MKTVLLRTLPLVLALGAAFGNARQAAAAETTPVHLGFGSVAGANWHPPGACATFTWDAKFVDGSSALHHTETICDGEPHEGDADGEITRSVEVPVGTTVRYSVRCETPPPTWTWNEAPALCGKSFTTYVADHEQGIFANWIEWVQHARERELGPR